MNVGYEKQIENETSNDDKREWVAPQMVILNTGATEGGHYLNTIIGENVNYHS